MKPIGLIGLGLMGSAMASRFRGAGFAVVGFDVSEKQLGEFAAMGGISCPSPRELFSQCDTIVLSLPTTQVVEEVFQQVGLLLVGKTILDTTTGDPEAMTQLGRRIANLGGQYLDANVLGSSAQVRTGDVIVMAGGEVATIAQCEPLLRTFATRVFHVGPCGSGARMKLVVNLVIGLNRAVLAESLMFATRYGVDPASALEVLRAGAAYSRVMDTKGQKMLDREFTPQAKLSQHLKDVRLIRTAGETCGAYLPLSELHERLLSAVEAAGLGELDNSAILTAFEQLR